MPHSGNSQTANDSPQSSPVIPSESQAKSDDAQELADWRRQIDSLDSQLLEILAQRQTAVEAIGRYKRERNLPPLDMERWQALLTRIKSKADEHGLCPDFASDLYHLIHDYSLKLESEHNEQT